MEEQPEQRTNSRIDKRLACRNERPSQNSTATQMCQIINKTIPIQAAIHMDINMNTLRLAETTNVWCR